MALSVIPKPLKRHLDAYEDYDYEGEGIVSNFHCPNCEAEYECRYKIK